MMRSRRDVLGVTGGTLMCGLAGCNARNSSDEQRDGQPSQLADETITVGVLTPLGLPLGKRVAQVADLTATRINREGGVAGADIEIVVADAETSTAIDQSTYQSLCSEHECDLTMGVFRGDTALELLDAIATSETIHFTTAAFDSRPGTRIAESYDEFKYHFRAGMPSYRELGTAQATFVSSQASERDWNRIAVFTENVGELTPYHEAVLEGLPDSIEIPLSGRHSGGSAPNVLMDEAEATDCELFLAGEFYMGLTQVNAWASQERSFDFGGLHLRSLETEFWEQTDGSVESVFSLGASTAAKSQSGGFVDSFTDEYGRNPAYSGAMTHDALLMYREAVESIVGEEDSELPSQEQIVEALESITFTDGVVYPEFEFTGPDADRVHEPVWESMSETGVPLVQQWQADGDGGQPAVIAPEEHKTADYQPPPWLDGR